MKTNIKKGFTVLMPTYNQCSYIKRAISSLLKQTFKEWELIIINDGCTDETETFLNDFLSHPKIKYLKNKRNKGLGFALNIGLDNATFGKIAYLPSDDYFYEGHLKSLYDEFEKQPDAILAVSGVKYENPDSMNSFFYYQSNYTIPNYGLQLVQTGHLLTNDRWMERNELVTDDLFTMFWHKLADKGCFSFSGNITCHWTIHPDQRHKKICEELRGGVHLYRAYYGVQEPLRIKVSTIKLVDEKKQYNRFLGKTRFEKKMKVLIVGELAYNPERVCVLEKYGCDLYGLWIQKPLNYNTIGPLPFGDIKDIPYDNWQAAVQQIKPDIIYALLNWNVVPLAHEVLKNKGDIPMVWHFKENPYQCMRAGFFGKLIDLFSHVEGKIYFSPEIKTWYEIFMNGHDGLSCIMDGEMAPQEYFTNQFSPKISTVDGAFHTVAPGRLVGVGADEMRQFAENDIHVHLYTDNCYNRKDTFIESMAKVAPLHFHLHPHCDSENWVEEFSRYDAGWLHCFKSANYGDIMKATWDDLNLPARMSTLAAAGLPMIQYDNSGHIVSPQEYLKKIKGGIFYKNAKDLRTQLSDSQQMKVLSENILKNRFRFCFDEYVPELMDFFNQVITKSKKL